MRVNLGEDVSRYTDGTKVIYIHLNGGLSDNLSSEMLKIVALDTNCRGVVRDLEKQCKTR